MEKDYKFLKQYYKDFQEGNFYSVIGDGNARDSDINKALARSEKQYKAEKELARILFEYPDEMSRINKLLNKLKI